MINNILFSNINIGGKCKRLEIIDNNYKLLKLVQEITSDHNKYKVIGSGSNIYFSNNYQGIIIKNNVQKITKIKYFPIYYTETIKNQGDIFIVSTGTILMDFIQYCQELGYDISKLSGIPGTIGGAIYNNSGAYGLEISEILIGATMIKNGKISYNSNKDFEFQYRDSILKKNDLNDVILTAFFKLQNKENKNIIQENIDRILMIRKNKLPNSEKNIGSIFKNIYLGNVKILVGELLENIGIKEIKYKNLEIYHKHSNIIINKGISEPNDLVYFINMIKDKFFQEYGIELELEIQKI